MEAAPGSTREAARKDAGQACAAALANGKFDRGWVPTIYRLQGTYDWLIDKGSRAQKHWRQSIAAAEKQGARYEIGLTYLEMGTRLKDSGYLEQAKALFSEMGAQFDLEQARSIRV